MVEGSRCESGGRVEERERERERLIQEMASINEWLAVGASGRSQSTVRRVEGGERRTENGWGGGAVTTQTVTRFRCAFVQRITITTDDKGFAGIRKQRGKERANELNESGQKRTATTWENTAQSHTVSSVSLSQREGRLIQCCWRLFSGPQPRLLTRCSG